MGIPEGERYQASLGGTPQEVPAWLLEALRGVGPQQVVVRDVDYVGARVQVYNSNGLRWARVLKTKTSGTLAGDIDMPNVNDLGLIVGTNGDEKAPVWLGALNSIETDNTLEKDANFTTPANLIHRRYNKHETGSFSMLDKLGNWFTRFMKKAATEADPAKKNLDIRVNKDGTIAITQYKADGAAIALSLDVRADGSLIVENDGHQVSLLAELGNEIFRYKHKKKDVTIQVTEDGDLAANLGGSTIAGELASGDLSLNHKSGSYVAVEGDAIEAETADGSTILLGKSQAQIALSTGQSVVLDNDGDVCEITAGNVNVDGDVVQLGSGPVQQPLVASGFFVAYNLFKAALATHIHTSALPGQPTSPPLPPQLAIILAPEVATPGVNVTAQVTGA